MRRTFEFNSSHGAGEIMAKVLEAYANTAYPLGGSDCAAASREALQSIAEKLVSSDHVDNETGNGANANVDSSTDNSSDNYVDINTRQRPMLKSALKWFYSESNNLQDASNSGEIPNPKIITLDQEMYENLLSQLQR